MNLTNKVALITGGTHGIGAETAIEMAKQGVKVSLIARNIDNATIKDEIEGIGAECFLIAADLSKEEECKRVADETYAKFGAIDILVHSAGSAAPGSLLNGARKVWYQAFDIHLHAIFHLS